MRENGKSKAGDDGRHGLNGNKGERNAFPQTQIQCDGGHDRHSSVAEAPEVIGGDQFIKQRIAQKCHKGDLRLFILRRRLGVQRDNGLIPPVKPCAQKHHNCGSDAGVQHQLGIGKESTQPGNDDARDQRQRRSHQTAERKYIAVL